MFVFGFVLTIAVTLLQAYAFWRTSSIPAFQGRRSRMVLIGFGVVMWGLFLAARFYGHTRAGCIAALLDSVAMYWLGVMLLIAVPFAVVDGLTGFGLLFRAAQSRLRTGALAAGSLLVVTAWIQAHRPPVVDRYEVPVRGLAAELDGTTIVAISDLHLATATQRDWLAARVDQVQAQHPDLVVLLGDIVEGHGVPDAVLARELARLSAPLGVWAVAGNHESHAGSVGNGMFLASAGIGLLRNEAREIRPGLRLAGVDDLAFTPARVARRLAETLPASGHPTILLSHAPVGAAIAAQHGVALMLAGHTHGGQLWPFSYLVAQRYPFFDGRYAVGTMTLLVCRGTGTWGPRMRLWRPSNLLRITLRSA